MTNINVSQFVGTVSLSEIMEKQYVIGCQFTNLPFTTKTLVIPISADRILPHTYFPFLLENHSIIGSIPTQIQAPKIKKESPFFKNKEYVKSEHFSIKPQIPDTDAARKLK